PLVLALQNNVRVRVHGKGAGDQGAALELVPAVAGDEEADQRNVADVPRVTEGHDRRVVQAGAFHVDVKEPVGDHRVGGAVAGAEEEAAGGGLGLRVRVAVVGAHEQRAGAGVVLRPVQDGLDEVQAVGPLDARTARLPRQDLDALPLGQQGKVHDDVEAVGREGAVLDGRRGGDRDEVGAVGGDVGHRRRVAGDGLD